MQFELLIVLACCVSAYFMGSINFAILISSVFYGKDIRNYGSKNAGMTNVFRTFGKIPAILTFVGDFSKGMISIFMCNILFSVFLKEESPIYASGLIGICALLGHVFPIFYKFKGGKGVSVSAGVLLAVDWSVFLCVFLIFILIFLVSKIISLSSIISALTYPIFTFIKCIIMDRERIDFVMCVFFTLIISLIIVFMHRSNIRRLLKGNEPKIKM